MQIAASAGEAAQLREEIQSLHQHSSFTKQDMNKINKTLEALIDTNVVAFKVKKRKKLIVFKTLTIRRVLL